MLHSGVQNFYSLATVHRRWRRTVADLMRCQGAGGAPERKDLDVLGGDPGKVELFVGVRHDDPKGPRVRYTMKERQRDLRTRQYAAEVRHSKPETVRLAEESLSHFNSRAAGLEAFKAYCQVRRELHRVALPHYSDLAFRQCGWKTAIKRQQSEQKFYDKIASTHSPDDPRQHVIAYGAWGLQAGQTGVGNKGNPSCPGVGLMRKLSKRFVVVITPEHYTSQTCCKCYSPCAPWTELEKKMGRKIRGIRVCQNEACRLPQNRDRTGAANIATQFCRLYAGLGPIRQLSDEEREFNRLEVCVACA